MVFADGGMGVSLLGLVCKHACMKPWKGVDDWPQLELVHGRAVRAGDKVATLEPQPCVLVVRMCAIVRGDIPSILSPGLVSNERSSGSHSAPGWASGCSALAQNCVWFSNQAPKQEHVPLRTTYITTNGHRQAMFLPCGKERSRGGLTCSTSDGLPQSFGRSRSRKVMAGMR